MNTTERELVSGFRSKMTLIRSDRTVHVTTFNTSTAKPGEDIYVDIPKLKETSCLVPGSLHLRFDFKVTGGKSCFLIIEVAGQTVYDCGGESLFAIYKDLLKTPEERKNMIE